jgi:phage shock protein PspC (stress-responsive transcriptional regulator)
MKYTFLSKWTVLILTLITGSLAGLGYYLEFGVATQHPWYALLAVLAGLIVYAFAWLIAALDAIQERKWGWLIGLILMLPFWIGPLLYSLFGPRNTK